MEFDPISFVLGFGSASGLSYGLWRYRQRIANMQASAEGQAERGREFLKRTADARYITDLTDYLQQYHVLGNQVNLSDVLIEPFVMPESNHEVLLEEDDVLVGGPTRVVPRTHDFPELYASFNLENMPLADVVVGDPYVAILGIPGSGKSTALATLGLMSTGAVEFQSDQERVDEALTTQFKGLSDAERERRLKEFQEVQKRAIEGLRVVKRGDEGSTDVLNPPEADLKKFFPVFFHIGDIDLDLNLYGIEVDPAEPIIHAFQQYMTLVTGQAAPPVVYQQLGQGNCLVLIDGFDDLFPGDQAKAYMWLKHFMETYGHNRIVITGPATGYDPLLQLGFTPTFIKPWSPREIDSSIQRWIQVWPAVSGAQQSKNKKKSEITRIDDKVRTRLVSDNRNRTPLEITLKTYAALAGDEQELGRRGWFERYVRNYIPAEITQSPIILREMAMVMQDKGLLLNEEQMTSIASNHLTDAQDKPITNIDQFVKGLISGGLLVKRAGNAYGFRHPLIMGYLGGERLIKDMRQRLAEVASQPNWQYSIGFAAAELDLTTAVYQKLSSPPDLMFSNLFAVVRWLPDASSSASWRGEILKRLGAALLAVSQYPTIRERAVAALIASRDKNILFILRQAIRNADPVIRKLACVSMGAFGDSDVLKDLRPMLVDDDTDVQLSAGLALGAIADDMALEYMVEGLLQGEEPLRQAVAEALAAVPGPGHDVLRDAIDHDDMMVRRAAAFGLARIPTTWALVGLYRAMLEDGQWYVRSAAERAFAMARAPERTGPRSFPRVEQLSWLSTYAAELGEGVPEGDKARQLVVRALQEGQSPRRMRAAYTLGQVGGLGGLKPLYMALMDKDEKVRLAAYEALSTVQMRATAPLPGLT